LKERNVEIKCIACNKGKRKRIPPKARWKEEQKERAQDMKESQSIKTGDSAHGDNIASDM
jgi:hypothetical protein